MPTDDTVLQTRLARLERQIAFQSRCGTVLVLALIALCAAAFRGAPAVARFEEIDVERINIVEPDGRLALLLANRDLLPDPIIDGKVVETGRSGPGMLFFNAKGDECGGLVYTSAEKNGTYQASAHFSFDQYQNDQVLFLTYQDNGIERSSGLHVVDRPVHPNLSEVLAQREAARTASAQERARLEREMQASMERGEFGAQRVFVGSAEGTALLRLSDKTGRPRIRLAVDADDQARLEFLDESGKVVLRLPERAGDNEK